MENFTIDNPTHLHFGKNVIKDLGKTIAGYGKSVLLVYGGGSIKKNGIYDAAVEQLKAAGVQWWEYGGIRPNPIIEDVEKAAALGRQHSVDVVLAIGGGSVIDSAKIIAITIPVSHPAWNFYSGDSMPKTSVPLINILTLAATGTEMNSFAVVQNQQTQEKLGYAHKYTFARHSFLDPSYTLSVPKDYTAFGIADLIAHCLEAYFGDGEATMSDKIVFSVINEALEFGPALVNNLKDYELREKIMYAATLALNGWTLYGRKRGDWGVHSIGHTFSVLYDTAHGASLTIAYPAWLKIQKDRIPGRLQLLFKNIFGTEDIDEGIRMLEDFFTLIGSPVLLQQEGIDKDKRAEIISLMKKNKVARFYHILSDEDYENLLDYMYGSK